MADHVAELFIRQMTGEGFDASPPVPEAEQLERARSFARAFGVHRNGFLVCRFRSGVYLERDGDGFWYDGATVTDAFRQFFQQPGSAT